MLDAYGVYRNGRLSHRMNMCTSQIVLVNNRVFHTCDIVREAQKKQNDRAISSTCISSTSKSLSVVGHDHASLNLCITWIAGEHGRYVVL